MLGVSDVPTRRARLELDGVTWDLEPFGTAERGVPGEGDPCEDEDDVRAVEVRMYVSAGREEEDKA